MSSFQNNKSRIRSHSSKIRRLTPKDAVGNYINLQLHKINPNDMPYNLFRFIIYNQIIIYEFISIIF